jgi:hypothetical protein
MAGELRAYSAKVHTLWRKEYAPVLNPAHFLVGEVDFTSPEKALACPAKA